MLRTKPHNSRHPPLLANMSDCFPSPCYITALSSTPLFQIRYLKQSNHRIALASPKHLVQNITSPPRCLLHIATLQPKSCKSFLIAVHWDAATVPPGMHDPALQGVINKLSTTSVLLVSAGWRVSPTTSSRKFTAEEAWHKIMKDDISMQITLVIVFFFQHFLKCRPRDSTDPGHGGRSEHLWSIS